MEDCESEIELVVGCENEIGPAGDDGAGIELVGNLTCTGSGSELAGCSLSVSDATRAVVKP